MTVARQDCWLGLGGGGDYMHAWVQIIQIVVRERPLNKRGGLGFFLGPEYFFHNTLEPRNFFQKYMEPRFFFHTNYISSFQCILELKKLSDN